MRAAILIHGFATDRNDFARLAPILSVRYDEIWCADLPAHGEGTERATICADHILNTINAAFDEIASRHHTIDVIGFSMGGALATMLAATRRINRLILLAPANKFIAPTFVASTLRSLISSGKAERSLKVGTIKHRDMLSVKELFGDIGDGLKFFRRLVKRYTAKNLREFAKVIKTCNDKLSDITVPTLIIWGKMDQLVPFNSVRHVVGHCRHNTTKVLVFPDVSHMMFYSRAHFRITDEILKFLEHTDPLMLN